MSLETKRTIKEHSLYVVLASAQDVYWMISLSGDWAVHLQKRLPPSLLCKISQSVVVLLVQYVEILYLDLLLATRDLEPALTHQVSQLYWDFALSAGVRGFYASL